MRETKVRASDRVMVGALATINRLAEEAIWEYRAAVRAAIPISADQEQRRRLRAYALSWLESCLHVEAAKVKSDG